MNGINSTAANIELQEQLQADLERKELRFNHSLSTVALFGLVVLPLIPGSLSFASIVAHFPELLGIPLWLAYMIALFTAVGVEVLGLVVIKLALRMRKFNHKAKGYAVEPAPLGQGVAAAALYLGVVLALVVLLKVVPAMSIWALIPLACLGAIADWAFALQGDQSEREADLRRQLAADAVERDQHSEIARLNATISELQQHIADHEVDAQALQERVDYTNNLYTESVKAFDSERQALQSEIVKLTAQVDTLKTIQPSQVAPQVASTVPVLDASALDNGRQVANENKRNQRQENLDKLVELLSSITDPDAINKADIARQLGVSRQTVVSYFDTLEQSGRIHINGAVKVN